MSAQEEIGKYHLHPDAYIALGAVLLAVSTVTLGLRVYVRGWMTRAWGLDDTLLVLSWAVFVADAGNLMDIGVIQLQTGLTGRILDLISRVTATSLLYIGTHVLLKASLAVFVTRILLEKWHIWLVRISLVIYLIFGVIIFFLVLFACGEPKPINYFIHSCMSWDKTLGPICYIFAVLNAMMDWTLTMMPIVVISKLHISRREKIAACVLILLGVLGSVVSVVRIAYVSDLQPSLKYGLYWFNKVEPIALCSVAESGIGIIALSLAALRPLWRRMVESSQSRWAGTADRGKNGPSSDPSSGPSREQTTLQNTVIRQDIEIIQKRLIIGGSTLVTEVV